MKADDKRYGYQEIPHTADLALKVWAPDLAQLLVQAALGMNSLLNIQATAPPPARRTINLAAEDGESLLVLFLSELLYFFQQDRIVFDEYHLGLNDYGLHGEIAGLAVTRYSKEIKAVTFHNLKIEPYESGLHATLVFDV